MEKEMIKGDAVKKREELVRRMSDMQLDDHSHNDVDHNINYQEDFK